LSETPGYVGLMETCVRRYIIAESHYCNV
jgi:hypothetical protein